MLHSVMQKGARHRLKGNASFDLFRARRHFGLSAIADLFRQPLPSA
jgi:hypothetical protein